MLPERASLPRVAGGLPFTVAGAAALGLAPADVHRLVRTGRLRPVLDSVYVDASVPDDLVLRARGATLVMPKGGVIARRTAAALHGVDVYAADDRHRALVVECLVPAGTWQIRYRGVRGFTSDVRPDDVLPWLGMPVTSPARTAADLLRLLPPHLALAAADAYTHAGLTSVDEIGAVLLDWTARRGVAQARRLLGYVEPLTESFGESFLRLRVIDAQFPRPLAQIPIFDRSGRVLFRLDLGWPDIKLALEYDGALDHSDPESIIKDGLRRAEIAKHHGWTILVARQADVFGRSLELEHRIGTALGIWPMTGERRW